jgi:DeoR family transcriptional regulator, fructose operon transcriptional repressor
LERVNADERLSAMVEVLQRDGRLDVADMAASFGTAEMTIRRDLDRIVALGMARRVRGGAISLLMRGEELPFALRVLDRADAKGRIAATVAGVLRDGEAVALDSGTTAVLVARELASRRLTVMPMTVHAASVLTQHESIRLLLPGGDVRPGELAMVGPLALASIGALRFDTAVLTCCGLDDDRITTHDLRDAEVKRSMIGAAARVILAADGAKFKQTALAVVAPVTAVDMIVTDTSAPPDTVGSLRAAGLEVLCV